MAPTFSSPELQKAVADAAPVLEGIDEARNRVSNDIRALETYLQSLDQMVPFRHSFGKFLNAPDEDVHGSIECSGTASGEVCEEALVWGPDSKGRFRLQYELSRWDGYVDIDAPGGPWFWESATLRRDAKPLIESPFETRKKMYRHLPDFVTSLARELDINEPQITAPPNGSDIPF